MPVARGAPRLDEALGDVALAAAVDGGVHRQAEGVVAGVDRAPDIVVHPGIVAAHVELEDARPVAAGRGTLLEAGFVTELTHDRHAEPRGARAAGRGALGVEDSSEPTGASMTGMRRSPAEEAAGASTAETSRSTRGRKAMLSSARRLRRSVVSVSVPPTR